MISSRLALVATLATIAIPANARDQQHALSNPANQAANAREAPVTQALNNAVDGHLTAQAALTADQQAQYDLDRAAYRSAIRTRAAIVGADQARYLRQEEAYARAMLAWRVQTDECKRGILKSCSKPTPLPADFY